ncbi:hypothetical protein BDQ17DRAFT_1431792 [Cyathus striatus]|nr:hypothetical protein BDQ17DRAFT_1431792 [Cyathus striatus]
MNFSNLLSLTITAFAFTGYASAIPALQETLTTIAISPSPAVIYHCGTDLGALPAGDAVKELLQLEPVLDRMKFAPSDFTWHATPYICSPPIGYAYQ